MVNAAAAFRTLAHALHEREPRDLEGHDLALDRASLVFCSVARIFWKAEIAAGLLAITRWKFGTWPPNMLLSSASAASDSGIPPPASYPLIRCVPILPPRR